jgi:hypothetical protein
MNQHSIADYKWAFIFVALVCVSPFAASLLSRHSQKTEEGECS